MFQKIDKLVLILVMAALLLPLGAASAQAKPAWEPGRTIYNLGEQRAPEAVPFLIQKLHDLSPTVRRMAAKALGKIGDPRGINPLLAVLRDTNEKLSVRCAAAQALGRMRSPQALEALAQVATQCSCRRLRKDACVALMKIARHYQHIASLNLPQGTKQAD